MFVADAKTNVLNAGDLSHEIFSQISFTTCIAEQVICHAHIAKKLVMQAA
jgi:hypothetical protein